MFPRYFRHNLDERTPSDVTGRRMFDPFDEYRIPKLVRAIVTEIEFPIHLREGFIVYESVQQLVMVGIGFVSA